MCRKIKHGCQNNYTYLEKHGTVKNKKTEMTGGPSTTDSSNKQCSNQLSLDAKTSRHTKSNDKAVQIGNSKKLAVICQGSAQRVNQGFAYNLKLTINIDKTEKSKIIFHLESGDVPGISSGLFQEGSSLLDCFQ